MALVVVEKTPDAVLSLDQVKQWLRVTNADEDQRLLFLLADATEYVEQHSRQVLSPIVYQLLLDQFPAVNWYQYYPVMAPFPQLLTLGLNFFLPNQTIQEPVYPVTAIDSIQYVDVSSGATVTLDPSQYTVDLASDRLAPSANNVWPDAKNQLNAVTIQFQAGYQPGKIPVGIQRAILNHCLLSYTNPGGIPEKDQENLDRAIEAQRLNLLF